MTTMNVLFWHAWTYFMDVKQSYSKNKKQCMHIVIFREIFWSRVTIFIQHATYIDKTRNVLVTYWGRSILLQFGASIRVLVLYENIYGDRSTNFDYARCHLSFSHGSTWCGQHDIMHVLPPFLNIRFFFSIWTR